MNKTVLLGAAGTGTAFAMAVRLRACFFGSVRIVGIDINPPELVTASVLCDEMVAVPLASDPGFADVLANVIKAHGVDTFVPIVNEELGHAVTVSQRSGFELVDIWSSPLAAQLARDKAAAANWLDGLSVPQPKSIDISNAALNEMVFVKPVNGMGSRGTYAATVRQLQALDEKSRKALLVQELCETPEVTIDSFFDVRTGFQRAICRERLETKAGVCTKARIFFDAELSDMARRIAEALGQRGTICIQVMRARGKWVVTDLNMRPGGGTAMSCAAGHDVLSAAFACRWGLPYEPYFASVGHGHNVIVTRQYAEFVMT